MSKPDKKNIFFTVALKIAVSASGLITAIFLLILFLATDSSLGNNILFGLGFFTVSFFIIYFFSSALLKKRFSTLRRISKNISKKRFEDYEDVQPSANDELDKLVRQFIRSSKMVEREIQRLNKIENYRKEFIGDISHELKTPIFAIQGFIETLLNGALDDEEVNEVFLKKAMRNVNRLIYLTKDLMEISKLETGELKSNFQEIYLLDMVLDVVESLHYKAEKEGVDMVVHEFDKNLQVRADRNQIKQVLINLVENAIKYNRPNGLVEIGIKSFKKAEDKLLLYIKDTGIGIDKKDINRVTERFFRVDKSRSREKGGTGLGLSIVKHIMEAHGEQFFIESNPDQGSTFLFTLTKVTHVSV